MTAPARQRFLPLSITRIVDHLDPVGGAATDSEADPFDDVAELVAALYHFEFHGREKSVSDLWFRVAVDGESDAAAELSRSLIRLLEDSNYHRMSLDEVERAMETEMLIPLRLEVDLDDYRELLVYRRGSRHEEVEVSSWGGLRKRHRDVTVDTRLVLHTQVRSADWFAERGLDAGASGLVPDHVDLKHFRDVPRANIKSLLPSVQVRFRAIDSLLLGVPAVASGIVVLTTKLLTTLGLVFVFIGAWLGLRSDEPTLDQGALVALFGGLAALGGFLVRQWTKLKNRRVKYLKVLSEHLFHHSIGDGADVVHALMFAAEQQEVTEVLIAYRFLSAAPDGRSVAELDAEIEAWLQCSAGIDIDFDIHGAVTKLIALDLVTVDESASADEDGATSGATRLRARPFDEVLRSLKARWDALFADESAAHLPVTTQR